MEIYGCDAAGGNELSEPIPILRTNFSTLEKTECYFCQAGMPKNCFCTVECDNGQRILDGKRLCGDTFCFLLRERWNKLQDNLTICMNYFISKEVATTDPEKDVEAANNVEAMSVDI